MTDRDRGQVRGGRVSDERENRHHGHGHPFSPAMQPSGRWRPSSLVLRPPWRGPRAGRRRRRHRRGGAAQHHPPGRARRARAALARHVGQGNHPLPGRRGHRRPVPTPPTKAGTAHQCPWVAATRAARPPRSPQPAPHRWGGRCPAGPARVGPPSLPVAHQPQHPWTPRHRRRARFQRRYQWTGMNHSSLTSTASRARQRPRAKSPPNRLARHGRLFRAHQVRRSAAGQRRYRDSSRKARQFSKEPKPPTSHILPQLGQRCGIKASWSADYA